MADSASSDKPKDRPTRRSGKADPMVAAAIGKKLRTMYDDMLAEPVPSDLADLVRRLSGDAGGSKTGS